MNTQHTGQGVLLVVTVKMYREPSSKNIVICASSTHPAAVKRALVSNMCRTAAAMCTGPIERQEPLRLVSHIAA